LVGNRTARFIDADQDGVLDARDTEGGRGQTLTFDFDD
jgi:hypothetical protein